MRTTVFLNEVCMSAVVGKIPYNQWALVSFVSFSIKMANYQLTSCIQSDLKI